MLRRSWRVLRRRHVDRPATALLLLALAAGSDEAGHAQTTTLPALGAMPTSIVEVPSEFLLRGSPAGIEAIAARHGLTIVRQLDGYDIFLVRGPATVPSQVGHAASAVQELIAAVEIDPEVASFELNGIVIAPEIPSGISLNQSTVAILDTLSQPRTLVDFFGGQAWTSYLSQPAATVIRLADSHAASVTGAGVVAVIDTGVDPSHPLLRGSLVPGYDFVRDIAGSASEWADLDQSTVAILDQSTVSILDQHAPVSLNQSTVAILDQTAASSLNPTLLPPAFGHGTMVAGLVHLVAPTAKIMPLKAFKADGTSRVFDILRAIYYAVDNGVRVINMSFSTAAPSAAITRALNVATSRGVICVSSAGNLGQEKLVYPGALRNVVGVGSTTTTNPPARSSFSNYGNSLVSMAAPGEAIITTYPGGRYAGAWGTSFSTPLVAGAAALLLQVDPTLDQARADSLLGRADVMHLAGMGRGRLNLYEALRQLPDATSPAVTLTSPADGALLSGTIVVSASASDNVAVTGVRFLLGGGALGAEDTAAPYELALDTTKVANGSHTLTAVARDRSGNETAASVRVTVSNDLTAPTVTVTSPVAGATASGVVTLTATAADDVGVVGVQFLVDGVALGGEDTEAPYEVAWETIPAAANGAHTVTAVARDAAGRQTTAASVSVTVANNTPPPD